MKDEGKEESGFRSGIICKLKIYFVKTRPAIKCSNVKKEPVDSRLGPSLFGHCWNVPVITETRLTIW